MTFKLQTRIILLLLAFATSTFAYAEDNSWIKLKPVSLVSLQTGQRMELVSDNKLTLIYFLASWCDRCQSHTEMLRYLQQRYAGLGLRTVLVYMHEPAAEAKAHLDRMGFTSEAYLSSDELIKNFFNPIAPTIFLIDRNGYLTGKYTETSQLNELSQLVTLTMSI